MFLIYSPYLFIMKRCSWVTDDELYWKYHDEEWGVPVYDDLKLFEFLILEGAQAGLSWITILKKRENYREAFDGFDYEKIALYSEDKIEELMRDVGIVRNRLKILSAINNAKRFIEVRDEFGSFSKYLWGFAREREDGELEVADREDDWRAPTSSELSDEISKDLKKRGFNFVGSIIVYAFLQAVGVVDDHESGCFRKNGD
jgi:DNA-3-methyladenine glycosylase I